MSGDSDFHPTVMAAVWWGRLLGTAANTDDHSSGDSLEICQKQ